jgi:hypothetical protein
MYQYALYIAKTENEDANIFVGNFDTPEEAWSYFNSIRANHACVVEFMV